MDRNYNALFNAMVTTSTQVKVQKVYYPPLIHESIV